MTALSDNHDPSVPARAGNPSVLRQLATFWRHYEWELILLLFFLALALGYIGFDQYWVAQGRHYSPLTLLYQSLLLFSMQSSDAAGPVNLALEGGRWLAMFVMGWAVVKAVLALLSNRLRQLRVRRWRKHTLICGWSENARRWSQNLHGERLVMLTREATPAAVEWCGESRLPLFSSEANLKDALRHANAPQAATILCVDDDDATNIALAAVIHQWPCLPGQQPTCFVQINDPLLFGLLAETDLKTSRPGHADLEYFNAYERGARALLDAHPLPDSGDGAPPRLLIAGLGRLGERLLIHVVRAWQRRGASGRLPLVLVAPAASAQWATLAVRYPVLNAVCDCCCLNHDPRDLPRYDFKPFSTAEGSILAFVCLDDDGPGLAAGLLLVRALEGQNAKVVIALNGETAGLADLLGLDRTGTHRSLHVVGWREPVCSVELLHSGITEIFARAQHEEYLRTESAKQREQMARGEQPAPNAALVPWEQLAEGYRNANRDQVNDLGNKLKNIGYTILEDLELNESAGFTAEEIDQLSQMEHDRWVRERQEQGWVFGPVRDNTRKIHPDLILWADLTEDAKEKDRVMIRNIPNALGRVGLRVHRLSMNSTVG